MASRAPNSTAAVQPDLFDEVCDAYAQAGSSALSNAALYERVRSASGIDEQQWSRKQPVGKSAAPRNVLERRVRWHQQTLRSLGLLQRVSDVRGAWALTPAGAAKLTPAAPGRSLIAFSTDLGVALWSDAQSFFRAQLGEPIHLVLSSLPYPLRTARAYGGPDQHAYVDWACEVLQPLIEQMAPGGSLAINVGNDVFLAGSPARSLYVQRLTLALADRFNLSLMDTLIWENPARPPGPLQWASLSRQQMNASYEPIIWMTNDPRLCFADNRRILQPHSDKQLKLIAAGGEARSTSYGDGSHRVRPGSYSAPTSGKIPRNVISIPHNCAHKRRLAAIAREHGVAVHGATMPLKLAQLLVEFLTQPGQLVADPCSGWLTSAFAAEATGRRWVVTERMLEYLVPPAMAMRDRPGFKDGLGLLGLQGLVGATPEPASKAGRSRSAMAPMAA